MKAIDFQLKVKETYLKYFPLGYIGVYGYAYGGVYFKCGLISDYKDCSNSIRENDTISLSFGIHDNFIFNDSTKELEGKLVIDFNQAAICTKPKNQMYAMSHTKIAVRKITNTPEKILVALDKYFKKLKEQIKDEILNENLYGQERINVKYLTQVL